MIKAKVTVLLKLEKQLPLSILSLLRQPDTRLVLWVAYKKR